MPALAKAAQTWHVLFGAAYYHEYQPYERLAEDIRLMRAAGFSVIRAGESTWASYEPEPGRIGFAELRRVVDAAWEAGIKVIIGTPTYAIPPWMARLHPEVMAMGRDGRYLPYGARQNVDFAHPAFLFYAERLITAMAEEFGQHPAVLAWQVDNEIGAHELVNPHVLARFRSEVMERLGGVEGVNDKWGLSYWSHRLFSPEDLWGPAGNTNPGYALEWSRFQARLATEFLAWQRDLLRKLVSTRQAVIHCAVSGYGGAWSSSRSISEALDKSACNIYVPLQRALELPEPPEPPLRPLATQWQADTGTWLALFKADMGYSARGPKGERFYVTEAQATSIGGPATNVPPFPGQLRLMAHLFVARGAELIEYWHWHTLHYGAETYWGGVLGHDLAPGRIYNEVSSLGAELRQLGPALEGLVPDADVGFLYSEESRWAMACQPPLSVEGTAQPDPNSYHRIFKRFYSAACDARLQVRVLHPGSDWSGLSVLVVPALYIASDELLQRLLAYANGGGHLVVTFRSAYADEWARARWELAPGPLREAGGFWYQEYTTLAEPLALRLAGEGGPSLHPGALAEAWADGLVVEDATPLWSYEHPYLGGFSALVSRPVGQGRLSWVGTLPDRASTASLLSWALSERGLSPTVAAWGALPSSVRLNSARLADGAKLYCVANHSSQPVEVAAPQALYDLASEDSLGEPLALGPWESRLVRSS